MPKDDGYQNIKLGRIANEFGLNRAQAKRQLNNYKDAKYGNSQIKLVLDGQQLEEKM